MSTEFTVIYERDLETEISVSKKTNEEARLRRLERWPREAGLSLALDESGGNYMQIVKTTAAEYGLELGDKKWDIRREDNRIVAKLEWALLKGGQKVGVAYAEFEISLVPKEETENEVKYPAKVRYRLELSNQVLAEKASEGFVDLSGF